MSGPVGTEDTAPDVEATRSGPVVEITPARQARVGDGVVQRSLPTLWRRTVGAWCFFDHAPEATILPGGGMRIGPHPHMGLQTVTWLLAGEAVHRDSLGSEQLLRPGQLNLMTAGMGVAHAEQSPVGARSPVHAVQLWVAQPESTRLGPPAFEHHPELPLVEVEHAVARVMIGELAGVRSPARGDTDHLGADLTLRAGTATVPVDPRHEHALVVVDGAVSIDGRAVVPDELAYLGSGRDRIEITVPHAARALLIGGSPFEFRPAMWWNFVARTRDELTAAYEAWQQSDERFGAVASELPIIPAPRPPWLAEERPFRP